MVQVKGAIMRTEREISIGRLSERTGVPVSAIRFYEREGLMAPGRSRGGQRRYPRADIRRLSFIRICQRLGLSLAEIRGHLDALPEGRAPDARDWARLSGGMRRGLDARIAALERLRDRLDGCIGCGCLSLTACALWNPEDEQADRGPGAHRLER